MPIHIGVVRLRSSLSITDKKLQAICDSFLSRCNFHNQLVYETPNKDLMNVFFVQTGGSEIYFKDVYLSYPEPYIILARRENNSLAASMEIVSFLQGQNKRAFLLFGEEEEVGEKLLRFARFYEAKKKLASMRLGVIGRPSDWLIASNVDPIALKKKWGITLVNIPYKRLITEIEKGDIADDPRVVAMAKKSRRKDDLRFSFIIHQALKNICKQHHLDGFTLRCFDLVKKYQQTACLGFPDAKAMFLRCYRWFSQKCCGASQPLWPTLPPLILPSVKRPTLIARFHYRCARNTVWIPTSNPITASASPAR